MTRQIARRVSACAYILRISREKQRKMEKGIPLLRTGCALNSTGNTVAAELARFRGLVGGSPTGFEYRLH